MHQLYSMDFTQGFQYGPTWPIFGTSVVEGAFDNQASCVPSLFGTLHFLGVTTGALMKSMNFKIPPDGALWPSPHPQLQIKLETPL